VVEASPLDTVEVSAGFVEAGFSAVGVVFGFSELLAGGACAGSISPLTTRAAIRIATVTTTARELNLAWSFMEFSPPGIGFSPAACSAHSRLSSESNHYSSSLAGLLLWNAQIMSKKVSEVNTEEDQLR
jgi:hypothetical protein